MTKPACPRLFEAEALRDGRLAGAERLSFERHLGACPHCSREVEALRSLGERLRASAPGEADADELHLRRERTRLLAAFDATLVPPERTRAARGWLAGLAAAALLFAGTFGYFRTRTVAPSTAMESAVVVHADSTAAWSRRSEGAVEKIVLERGALSIRVDHAQDRRRLLVVLPDGELEDIGTTFTVSADAGRTTRVSVQSGSVVLRIHGQPPLALSQGDTWNPPRRVEPVSCASCDPAREPAPASVDGPVSAATPSAEPVAPPALAQLPRATSAAIPPRSTASAPASGAKVEANPSLDFRAAVAALDSGDNATAAARFESFLTTHPGDARTEDAAYLRVIALQRTGNVERMREAAAHYLRRYPEGFRHAEVAGLAR